MPEEMGAWISLGKSGGWQRFSLKLELTRIEGKTGGGSVGSAALLCAGVSFILGTGFLRFGRSSTYMPRKDRRTFSKAIKKYQKTNAAPRIPPR